MSSLYVASNNGSTTLATASINSTATSFTVASGQGDRFPSPTGGDYTLVTFENGSTREIMCIVGRSTDTFTVGIPGSASANVAGRNYESIFGMSATTWTSGAVISCRATSALIVAGVNSTPGAIATVTHAATAKTPVIDADEIGLIDSAASWVLKKFTLTTLWTWIQTHLASPGAIGATTPAAISGTTGTFSGAVSGTTLTTTSGQIVFPATQNPSADANTLDDYQEGTFTGTFTGFTSSPTLTFAYTKVGKLVTLTCTGSYITATSNSTSKAITGLPSDLVPSGTLCLGIYSVSDNGGTYVSGLVFLGISGSIAVYPDVGGSPWTASGTAIIRPTSLSYIIS